VYVTSDEELIKSVAIMRNFEREHFLYCI